MLSRLPLYKHCVLIKYYFKDNDVVHAIFETCQNPELEGVTLKELEKEECIDTLEAFVGLPINQIEPLFKEADANGDGILLKAEVMKAYGGMALDRSNPDPPPANYCTRSMNIYDCCNCLNCNGKPGCSGCRCPEGSG